MPRGAWFTSALSGEKHGISWNIQFGFFAINAPPAIMDVVEQNQVRLRLIVENANSNGLVNRAVIRVLTGELKKRGLEDFVEIRFFNGRVHAKTALIDQELLIVGSQNFHYSSWGEGGLNEFGVATDDPEAIALYQKKFDYHWERTIPFEEADWAAAK